MILLPLLVAFAGRMAGETIPPASFFGAKSIEPFHPKPGGLFASGFEGYQADRYLTISENGEYAFSLEPSSNEWYAFNLRNDQLSNTGRWLDPEKEMIGDWPTHTRFIPNSASFIQPRPGILRCGPSLSHSGRSFAFEVPLKTKIHYPFWIWINAGTRSLSDIFHVRMVRYYQPGKWEVATDDSSVNKVEKKSSVIATQSKENAFFLGFSANVIGALDNHCLFRELDLPLWVAQGYPLDLTPPGYKFKGAPYRFFFETNDAQGSLPMRSVGSYLPRRLAFSQVISLKNNRLQEYEMQQEPHGIRIGIATVTFNPPSIRYRWLFTIPNKIKGWTFNPAKGVREVVYPESVDGTSVLLAGQRRERNAKLYKEGKLIDVEYFKITHGRAHLVPNTDPMLRPVLSLPDAKYQSRLPKNWFFEAYSPGGQWVLVSYHKSGRPGFGGGCKDGSTFLLKY